MIDTRYENPHYLVEDAGAADLISGGRIDVVAVAEDDSLTAFEAKLTGWKTALHQDAYSINL